MVFIATLVCLLITAASLIFYFIKRRYNYWKDRGIPHDTPVFPYGNVKDYMTTRHGRYVMQEYYEKYKHSGPFAGMYFFITPVAFIVDLDLIKDILIKDFHNFSDRGMFTNDKDDPLSGHLFSLDGEKWRTMRNIVSPTFTSGKMKFMFPTIVTVCDELLDVVSKTIEIDPVVEIKDLLARFTTDVIGTCAFGIECNSLKDPNVEFRVFGVNAFTKTRHGKIVEGLIIGFPELAKKLRMRLVHDEIHDFFMKVVRDTVEYREKNSIKRNDFMDLMIDMKNSGAGLTVEQIAAQAFIFFVAGYETSSTTMGFALYELALNQEIQDKLRTEINSRYDQHNGQFKYEAMAEMPYMEKVIKETLRKYAPSLALLRKCRDDYPTKNPNFTIPKGTMIFIQVDAIQNDPELYPNPDKFDPERFSPEEVQKRHPMTWLPFGDGPRNCVGLRFGKMQINVGLAMLLRNYKFNVCEKTQIPLEFDIKNPLLSSKGGIYLRVEKIKQ
ncbi:probable cytochrome P450 6a20 [Episyrphus balteatus]|uniref:probable cytochrome P450 6a20 n=1 Tax=Episyrphus balteatus TaxID=286459 RepID=UPI0024858ED5|nr:probable cytochrome P450 6a20 [Episyrphus balteatus]